MTSYIEKQIAKLYEYHLKAKESHSGCQEERDIHEIALQYISNGCIVEYCLFTEFCIGILFDINSYQYQTLMFIMDSFFILVLPTSEGYRIVRRATNLAGMHFTTTEQGYVERLKETRFPYIYGGLKAIEALSETKVFIIHSIR